MGAAAGVDVISEAVEVMEAELDVAQVVIPAAVEVIPEAELDVAEVVEEDVCGGGGS